MFTIFELDPKIWPFLYFRISLGGGGSLSDKKKTPGRSRDSTANTGSGAGPLRKCKMCPETFDKTHNLKWVVIIFYIFFIKKSHTFNWNVKFF